MAGSQGQPPPAARAARRWPASEDLVGSGGRRHTAIVPYLPGCSMERMPSSPYPICLCDAERAELESVSRRATAPFRLVLRSRIVLLAAAGTANRVIAERLGTCEDTARKWRRRYCEQGIEGLADAPRPGRRAHLPCGGGGVQGLLAMPSFARRNRARRWVQWSCPTSWPACSSQRRPPPPSASTVRRWLADDALKPWQRRPWDLPGDHALRPASVPGSLTSRQAEMGRTAAGERRAVRAQRGRRSLALSRPGCASTCRSPRRARPGGAGRRASDHASATGTSPTSPPTTSTTRA